MVGCAPGACAWCACVVKNALTVDVEEHFQVAALACAVPRGSWNGRESRVVRSVERLLDLFDAHRAHATFFTLGWVARRHPGMVRDILASGHELASHGYAHERVSDQTPGAFFADIVRARHVLEEIGGVAVRGYRAPNFSISDRTPWAHELIAQAGYRYSSSVYPVRHDHYGVPQAPRFVQATAAPVREIPLTTVRVGQRNWPAAGGGFFRLLPYGLSRWMIERVNRTDGAPAIFYLHPWEIDPGQPRVAGLPFKNRFRHYLNLERTEARLARLLGDFAWGRMDEVFAGSLCEG